MISYQVGDGALTAEAFLKLVNRVWPGEYDLERTEAALARTLNITRARWRRARRLPAHFVGRLLFRNHHRTARPPRIPTARNRQPAASPRAGKRPYPALFRRAARTRTLLRAKWLPQKPAIL